MTMQSGVQNKEHMSACTQVSIEAHRATVCNVPLSAYTGWQHPFVTPLALARLAVHCRRAAYDEGWLDPQGGFFSLSRDSLQRRVVPLPSSAITPHVSRVGEAVSASQFSTVFIVAMEANINDAAIGVPIRNHVSARAELFVSAVGNSSFGLGACLYATGAENDRGCAPRPSTELYLGSVQLSYVHIDFETRRPHPLPDSKRVALTSAFLSENALKVPKLLRLNAGSILAECLQKKKESVSLFHELAFALRPSDYDFNLHLNQSMYQAFALDTLKDAVLHWVLERLSSTTSSTCESGQQSTLDKSVLHFLVGALFTSDKDLHENGESFLPLMADAAAALQDATARRQLELAVLQVDSLVTALRIDFVKEIPMPIVTPQSDSTSTQTSLPTTSVVGMLMPHAADRTSVTFNFCVCTQSNSGIKLNVPDVNSCGIITLGKQRHL